MSRRTSTRFGVLGVLGVGFVVGYIAACSNTQPTKPSNAAEADKNEEPTKIAEQPNVDRKTQEPSGNVNGPKIVLAQNNAPVVAGALQAAGPPPAQVEDYRNRPDQEPGASERPAVGVIEGFTQGNGLGGCGDAQQHQNHRRHAARDGGET